MTAEDRWTLFRTAVERDGQGAVAEALGYSRSTISECYGGTYKGDPGRVLRRAEEVYSAATVACPVLGEVRVGECAEHRRRPFAATNPMRVALYRACRECPRGERGGDP
ncbi:MAG: transcriptional regulator [Thermodesulfobacteriota bacterium]